LTSEQRVCGRSLDGVKFVMVSKNAANVWLVLCGRFLLNFGLLFERRTDD
jgi:hypothetical protein